MNKILVKILKILFPFYNYERHNFLYQKWWFRLLIVVYIVGIFVGFIYIGNILADSYWGWCYDSSMYYDNYSERLELCGKFMNDYRWKSIGESILYTLIFHYLIQFILFKIIINFVVLGNKK